MVVFTASIIIVDYFTRRDDALMNKRAIKRNRKGDPGNNCLYSGNGAEELFGHHELDSFCGAGVP